MNRKTALVTLGVAAAFATGTIVTTVAVPALAASSSPTVIQHFDAESSSAPLLVSKTSFVLTDTDVVKHKTIGHDVLSCTDTGTGTTRCHVVFAQRGGLLYARFALSDKTGRLKGAVTGGTGSFAHAKGTLAGQAVTQKDVRITLHYKK
ncbi:hypothetical protein [uncultured Jatrophihabitans sp.]|uniref:hypothetical protein n=1 Tax=uncultured Jatrophihabitans sp. TaxID=1610747 RepID=UPI0035CA41AB